MNKRTKIAPATAELLTAALDLIDALFDDFNQIDGDSGFAYSILRTANEALQRMRAVVAGESSDGLDMYALAALIDGARHLPSDRPGSKMLLHTAYAVADAVGDVMANDPDPVDDAVTALAKLLESAGTDDYIAALGDSAPGILYEHDDGRYRVAVSPDLADFASNDPAWHRAGPVDISMACQADTTNADPAEVKDRRDLANDAAGQIEALTDMLVREHAHASSEFSHHLLPQMLQRIKAVNSVILSVLGGDDERPTEELREVIHG